MSGRTRDLHRPVGTSWASVAFLLVLIAIGLLVAFLEIFSEGAMFG